MDRSGHCTAGQRRSAAKTFSEAGCEVTTATVDVSSRASVEALVALAGSLGDVHAVVHAAGVSPSQAAPGTILKVDLYGWRRDVILLVRRTGARVRTQHRAEGRRAGSWCVRAADHVPPAETPTKTA
nr:KR domain-containing protein [uncultured Rhodopila sp.]